MDYVKEAWGGENSDEESNCEEVGMLIAVCEKVVYGNSCDDNDDNDDFETPWNYSGVYTGSEKRIEKYKVETDGENLDFLEDPYLCDYVFTQELRVINSKSDMVVDLNNFCKFSGLKSFYIESFRITDTGEFKDLEWLEKLEIKNCLNFKVCCLKDLVLFKELKISNVSFKNGDLDVLSSLKYLKKLHISDCQSFVRFIKRRDKDDKILVPEIPESLEELNITIKINKDNLKQLKGYLKSNFKNLKKIAVNGKSIVIGERGVINEELFTRM